MKNKNSGQSMVEALFVVVFTTIVMFCFLQICIMAVDDMTANEAAFVAMRSAVVTRGEENRRKEAKKRVENYMLIFYPFTLIDAGSNLIGSFGYSDKKTVKPFFIKTNRSNSEDDDVSEQEENNSSATLYNYNRIVNRRTKDYSGTYLSPHTVKIYYFTRVMFGHIFAKNTSERDWKDIVIGRGGSRRYNSARIRMIPSPDSAYYEKAYPGAKKFDEE